MKLIGFLAGIPVAVATWIIVVTIHFLILSQFFGPNAIPTQGFAAICVFFIGPFAGISAWIATAKALVNRAERVARESEAEKYRREAAEEASKRKLLEDERLRILAEEQYKDRQRSIRQKLLTLNSRSQSIASDLPILIREANQALNLADSEYTEGVFAAFWDTVEVAAKKLATFNSSINNIVENAKNYQNEAKLSDQEVPPFRIGIDALPDATHTLEKLRAVVRRAQKQPDFAKIYEMRQHNQLLVAGFSSLREALANLSYSIQQSMDSLESSLSEKISELSSEQKNATEQNLTELRRAREQSAERIAAGQEHADREYAARREHERKERELLEKIQQQTKPRA